MILDESDTKDSLIPFKGENLIEYFESKGNEVLIIRGVKDVEKISSLFELRDSKLVDKTLFVEEHEIEKIVK